MIVGCEKTPPDATLAQMPRDWSQDPDDAPAVRGVLHEPKKSSGVAIVLTHGAGSNRNAPLLVNLADAFAARGVTALRCDLPYRQARPSGPPSPAGAARDRVGLAAAASSLSGFADRVFLSGSSYGGRQATMLAAESPDVAAALLLLSYPLHPPGKAAQLRTEHFPAIQAPCLFVHGSKDTFGTLEEMGAALRLIPARHELLPIEGGTHGLSKKADAGAIADAFLKFVNL
jgi:predicted alpha/beta-hydrolase family hydrolase